MSKREITCCFTGHRPQKLPWGSNENDPRCLKVKFELEARLEGIYMYGCRHFICGMAIGCDMFFAEAVLKLKERHGDVTLEAAMPCISQPDKWTAAQKLRYAELLTRCDEMKILQEYYTPGCMEKRNRYMVDNSSVLLACFDGRPGGTMGTILYAERQGLKTILIDI